MPFAVGARILLEGVSVGLACKLHQYRVALGVGAWRGDGDGAHQRATFVPAAAAAANHVNELTNGADWGKSVIGKGIRVNGGATFVGGQLAKLSLCKAIAAGEVVVTVLLSKSVKT